MGKTIETIAVQPLLTPQTVGRSMDFIDAQLPIDTDRLDGNIMGEYISQFKGDGFDINGVRDYVYGDNPRHIDWKASARQPDGTLQTREHHRDVTPNLWIVTDALQRRNEVNAGLFPEQQLGLSAVAAFLQLGEAYDMPTAVLATNNQGLVIREPEPAQGRQHLLDTTKQLVQAMPAAGERSPVTPLKSHLSDILGYAGANCVANIVVVVSDFRDVAFPDDKHHGWKLPLQRLKSDESRNEIIAVETTNPQDYALAEYDTRFNSGTTVHYIGDDKSSRRTRARYAENAAKQQKAIDTTLASVRAHHVKLSTTNPLWLTSLRKQLASPQY